MVSEGNADEPADPVLEALWARVLGAWDDEKPRAALLEHALRARRLPEIAARYRRVAEDPSKAAAAKRELEAIVGAAALALEAMKMPRPGRTPLSITLSAFGVCVLLLGWLAYAVWGRH